jgi:Domain of unknown function (DUF1992)
MTERKPPGKSFTSWIDQQVEEAEQRGAFDNLPGAGKPIPDRGETGTEAWLRDYLRREGVSAKELLPTPLRLRNEIEGLAEQLPGLRTEPEVRETVRELNRQIRDWRRTSVGPPVFVPLVDEEEMVRSWRAQHRATPTAEASNQARDTTVARRGWWHRLIRRLL